MNFLQQAAQLNNEGAVLLSNGDQKRALRNFKASLQSLQRGCSECSQQEHPTKDVPLSRLQVTLQRACPVSILNPFEQYCSQFMQSAECQQDRVQRHTFAFWTESELSLEMQSIASAVVMYNYSLGLLQQNDERKSMFLLQQCVQLLTPVAQCVDCQELCCSILKCQADVLYRLGDYQGVRAVFDELLLMAHQSIVVDDILNKEETKDEFTIAPSA